MKIIKQLFKTQAEAVAFTRGIEFANDDAISCTDPEIHARGWVVAITLGPKVGWDKDNHPIISN